MNNTNEANRSVELMDHLSALLLTPEADSGSLVPRLQSLSSEEFVRLAELANSNHVLVRGMERYQSLLHSVNDMERSGAAGRLVEKERHRIATATEHLQRICEAFATANLDLTVIKTLDHWPDFGSDIDLYTGARPEAVVQLMQQQFGATVSARSWGDRLAGKWNFEIAGLPEAVEIHMCRLGQTGEQLKLARNVPARSRVLQFGDHQFRVASASDRIMISTLQRMYRHFYFRLCDIVDSGSLAISGQLDWKDLRDSAQDCGIWEGTATYMVLVSDYVKKYTGSGITIPQFVKDAARFDGSVMYCGGSFLRVPIMPQSAGLYGSQLAGTLRRGEVHSSARLGMLPWLATAAAIGFKLTGSDKGIW